MQIKAIGPKVNIKEVIRFVKPVTDIIILVLKRTNRCWTML